MKNKKHESGRSMVEMVGVLAVMGLITAGAFVLLRGGMSSQKRNRVQDEIGNIASIVRTSSASLADFSNLPKSDVCKKGDPTFLANLDVQTATPFGGDTVYVVCQGEKNNFVVQIVNIDAKDCEALAQLGWAEGVAACDAKAETFSVEYGK